MKHLRIDDLPWEEWSSESDGFAGAGKQISAALGAATNAPLHLGGHPFDVEFGRLRPGKSGCPFHSHSAQWEFYVIASGEGTVRYGSHECRVQAGDVAMHPPGEAHQLINSGATDLTYWLVADNPLTEVWIYPDTDELGYRPGGGVFRRAESHQSAAAPPKPPTADAPPLARFARLADLPWEELRSPTGKYHSFCQNVSYAVGGLKDIGPWGGGHPFDWQRRRIPPGAAICPLHQHTLQWEVFLIQAGTATIRDGTGQRITARSGDIVLQPPGHAHQLINHGDIDVVVDIIADQHPADSTYYPESDKWQLKPQRKIFHMVETDYYDGEE